MSWLALIGTIAVACAMLVSVPARAADRLVRAAMLGLARTARRPVLAGAIILLAALVATAIPSLVARSVPLPAQPDEYSYLLAAHTFARGRLTNPPHPMGLYLQTPEVLQQPTYSSKYPPGQGLALAVGERLFGLPIVRAWRAGAAACLATFWVLRAALPPRFALLGGLLLALHPLLLSWNNSYWGGAVAATGGALLIGGALRLATRRPRGRDGLIAGAGLALLVLSRPFEGAIVALLLLVALAPRLIRSGASLVPPAASAVLLLAGAVAFFGFYNYRVTGQATLLPHLVHQ